MRLIITIIIVKIVRFILKIIGRGSSFPGKLALKLYPDILNKIALPKYIIAVTGSNGKTSTTEMLYEVLKNGGYSIAYNQEGSNQIDGVATLILNNSTITGHFNKDVLLIESDERYAQYTFSYFTPTHYIITNICRDQMTRNGNPEFVLNEIKKSIKNGSELIVNVDDPYLVNLAGEKAIYFGINDNSKKKNNYLYDDGYYCPACNNKLKYKSYIYAHLGNYECKKCGLKRVEPKYFVSNYDRENGIITINDKCKLKLGLNSIYNAYNVLAVYSMSKQIGIEDAIIENTLNNYLLHNGRVKTFKIGLNEGTLLISKHENSVSYNQNIEYVLNQNNKVTLLFIVDAISRKYFTSETSWLWDINFEVLEDDNVSKVIILGQYANDVALRLSYTNINNNKLYIEPSIVEGIKFIKENKLDYLYALTCFSDEKKLINEVILND